MEQTVELYITTGTLDRARAATEAKADPFNRVCLVAQGGKEAGLSVEMMGYGTLTTTEGKTWYAANRLATEQLIKLFDRGHDDALRGLLPVSLTFKTTL